MTGRCKHCGSEWQRPHRSRALFCPAGPCQAAQVLYARDLRLARSRRYEAKRAAGLATGDELAAERARLVETYAARVARGERIFA